MAELVEAALRERAMLVVEAGTGTGKTYAYLVPALLSGLRTVISTGTRTLQDQLFHRDLPRVREVLAPSVRVALLKGRGNYLCLHRMKRARSLLAQSEHAERLREVEDWARRTEHGELSELGEFTEDQPLTRQITSTADNCLGSRCEDFDDCFVAIARRRAQAANLVVVNHHLLLSDFTLKDQGFGQILAGADAVILDEAHQLPELAARFFGRRVSTRQILELARDAEIEAQNCGDLPELVAAAQRLTADVSALEACFASGGGGRRPLARFRDDRRTDRPLERLSESLDALHAQLSPLEERNAEIAAVLERAHDLRERWRHILAAPAEVDGAAEVRWVESEQQGGSFHATPIALAAGFRRMRETYPGAWVLTSATLAAGGDFSHFLRTLGIEDARTACLDSPFDYARQARLYLPRGMPDPNQPGYAEAVADAAVPVIEAGGGGAFVLCTSHRALRVIAQQLRAKLALRVLVQGEGTRSALLDDFTADGNAVLVGTSSFWEGVDVRGQALRLVIIDRLPFAAPGDPVLDARIDAIREAGGNPFLELQLPQAIVMLRQGVGRLIRDDADRGLLMLCDPRLTQKRYGREVLAALPKMPVLRELKDAMAWMRQLRRIRS
ncbi:ATP-dependent DNA helicase [Sinimarinibacterium thermocellulolyticum]|uniref:ATP-dependent DNA helicase n=1 Tax=Sinimarinibacterium thermocellulolyticum TaxID=3170016 RepID=A0ABV2AAQ6_9GAMM